MKSTIFLPKTIKVGYQERKGTYTGKLAYVIYIDEKGKVRKEASWSSWRDNKIEPHDYENVPTEGFVLNKKVGDYVSDWNHRQAYVRVYDPRGFEFEITIENLLYILENTNSIKGKGLEGEFVYGWSGKDMILIPTSSPDYVQIKCYTDTLNNNFKLGARNIKVGATYLTKDNAEWVYLGKYDKWESDHENKYRDKVGNIIYPDIVKTKVYYFYNNAYKDEGYYWRSAIEHTKSLTKFIGVTNEECDENFAEKFEKLESNSYYSPIDEAKNEYVQYTLQELQDKLEKSYYGIDFYNEEGTIIHIRKDRDDETLSNLKLEVRIPYLKQDYYHREGRMELKAIETFNEDINEIYEKYKICYIKKYLKNGKLHSEVK